MTDCTEGTMEREKLQRQVDALREQLADERSARERAEAELAMAHRVVESHKKQADEAVRIGCAALASEKKLRDANYHSFIEAKAESERLRAELAEAKKKIGKQCPGCAGALSKMMAERDTLAAQLKEARAKCQEDHFDYEDVSKANGNLATALEAAEARLRSAVEALKYAQEAFTGQGCPENEIWEWRGTEPFNDWLHDQIAALTAHTTAAEAPQTLIAEPLLTESAGIVNKPAAEDGKTCYLMGEIERRCANCGRVESHHITGRPWACMTFTPPASSPTEKPCDECGGRGEIQVTCRNGDACSMKKEPHFMRCPTCKPAGAAGEEK